MLKKLFFTLVILTVMATCGLAGWLYVLVVLEPGDEISEQNIESILGRESHVYYSDGTTKLGVFFDTAHRQYVKYSEIPSDFVNALVAAEDGRFFEHFGFDIGGIGRAMVKNIQAGKVVQGGSTLTQQTAKNLFKREDRSYKAKLKELLFALRLEYHYPKEKIFEFYANQFYVSGNGHGLGVAARYYFDKKPSELNLVECAFIAGSVKQPNYYNPFIKKTEEGAEKAKQRAKVRLRYVLDKMRESGHIDSFAYNQALAMDINFNQGRVGYSLDYSMELVREAVSSTSVREALEAQEISNIATSGVKVITTVDKGLQQETLASLRRELSRLDVRLRGYTREEVQKELTALEYSGDSEVTQGAFLFGTITEIAGAGKETKIKVELDKRLGEAVIDADGLLRLVLADVKYRKNLWSETEKKDLDLLVKELQVGDRVWVSVRKVSDDWEPHLLDLERYPLVQGGAIVVHKGKIRSIAGGSENRFYNRAIHAKRTMGSAFKPLVYAAALQLGWNSADLLKNSRDLFIYHGKPYFPRPDHVSPHEWVSMSWAGVHSENVASVWLLANLCDKLSTDEFHEVAEQVGLTPRIVDGQEEPYRAYRDRIRDRYGIQVNKKTLREAAYHLAVKNLETDFIFDDKMDEYQVLKGLHYGQDYGQFRHDIGAAIAQEKKKKKANNRIIDELFFRLSLLQNSYLSVASLRGELKNWQKQVELVVNQPFPDAGQVMASPTGAALYVDETGKEFYYMPSQSGLGGLIRVNTIDLVHYLSQQSSFARNAFWEQIHVNGTLTAFAIDKTDTQLEHEYAKLLDALPYEFDVLAGVHDFRVTVGLYYLKQLSKQLGINSELEAVLSFPLGSNVVTLFELTRLYEGLVTGSVTTFYEETQEEDNDSLAIIDRIESEDGRILYQPEQTQKNVIDAKTSLALGGILENIVKFGTGRAANKIVSFDRPQTDAGGEEKKNTIEELGLSVPLLGKTGTANNYTNASFFGYLPEVTGDGVAMTLDNGYAIGVYVGFDDNSPMRRKSSRISGSAGALPVWSSIANAIIQEQDYVSRLDPVDLSFNGLAIKRPALGQLNLGVTEDSGGAVTEPYQEVSEFSRFTPSILTFGKKSSAGRFVPERIYEPYWKTTGEAVQ
ncbi:transglycosylase domain-containing protein [Desulforhopalus sp. IMCC35007]|uniref:transglycosylase domain-containing protein n=1 Tax=Desulforhopalus sp. IMCC35007 TaxID=2569543 RepID=UPI0010AE2383|nr:transglycosylase domain-containing protein [Desulforhopalus sp. IMCC35007]TKB10628.1 glycosyl transferase family 51 [Desulforhopalus sp. IMCC35007]